IIVWRQKDARSSDCGRKMRALRNNPPACVVIPRNIYHLTFVKQGNESFMAAGDTFLTAIAFI
ncbi:hypothetical protein ACFGUE_000001, partial [Klebsiella aerogenes]